MPYVKRDGDGRIVSMATSLLPGLADEEIAEDAAELAAFIAAQSARPASGPTPLRWLERLSQSKQDAIAAAAVGNASIFLWLLKASGVSEIDVTDPRTIAGVEALVAAGVLSEDDKALLLA